MQKPNLFSWGIVKSITIADDRELYITSGDESLTYQHLFTLPNSTPVIDSARQIERDSKPFDCGTVSELKTEAGNGDDTIVNLMLETSDGQNLSIEFTLRPGHKAELGNLLMPPATRESIKSVVDMLRPAKPRGWLMRKLGR